MGTSWSARIVDPPAGVEAEIGAVLDMVIVQMSHWEPASRLSRFNRSAPGEWMSLEPEFAQVMAAAIDIADRSGGAFDPAMGAVVDLWGFGPPGPRESVPAPHDVVTARALSGHDALTFDPLLLRMCRSRAVCLDLSGIAKGYAVDAIAARLRALGCRDYLVEIGGEFAGEGVQPDGQPWWIDIELPPGLAARPLRIALHGLAVATSGDYRRAFEAGGTRYAHTIDPRTGHPTTNGVASVTVLHANCMHADAWASALTVLGHEAGMALADREGLAVQMVLRDNGVARTLESPALHMMLD